MHNEQSLALIGSGMVKWGIAVQTTSREGDWHPSLLGLPVSLQMFVFTVSLQMYDSTVFFLKLGLAVFAMGVFFQMYGLEVFLHMIGLTLSLQNLAWLHPYKCYKC